MWRKWNIHTLQMGDAKSGLQTTRILCPWNFPGMNIRVGCHFLLQGILPSQGQNLCLASPALACRFFTTEPPGKPKHTFWRDTTQATNSIYLSVIDAFMHRTTYLTPYLSSPNLPNITVEIFFFKKKSVSGTYISMFIKIGKQGQIFSYHESDMNVSFWKENWLFN